MSKDLKARLLDLKALTHTEAVLQIQSQQVPFLIDLFQEWKDKGCGDFEAYRVRAIEGCPGLAEIWEQPPQAIFLTHNSRVLVRFKLNDDGMEIAIDRLKK